MELLPAFNCNIQLFFWFSYLNINSTVIFKIELLEGNSEEEIPMFTENFETVIVTF